jgi:hypothetical protein
MTRAESAVMWFFSRDLGRAIYIQDVHQPDKRGHCSGCQTQMAPTLWPCVVRRLADETIARQIPLPRERSA